MSDKIYLGSAKAIQTQHGGLLKVSFKREDLETLLANVNQAGYVNLNVSKRKEVSQYGQTHSISIDDWTPNKQQGMQQAQDQAASPPQQAPQGFDDFDDDTPFSNYELRVLV